MKELCHFISYTNKDIHEGEAPLCNSTATLLPKPRKLKGEFSTIFLAPSHPDEAHKARPQM